MSIREKAMRIMHKSSLFFSFSLNKNIALRLIKSMLPALYVANAMGVFM